MSGIKVTRIATSGQELTGGSILDATYSGTDVDITTGLTLDGLLDVNAPAPVDQDVLTWDDGAGEWVAAPGGPGLDVVLSTVVAAGATETIDVSVARTYDVTLTADCTLTLTGAVAGEAWWLALLLRQDGTGGWDVTWPGSVVWPDGTPPAIDPAINALTAVTLGTMDGGTTWLGFPAGGSTLDGLLDVNAPAPVDGDGIVWRDGSSAWVNEHALTEADVVALLTPDIYACVSLTVISAHGTIAAGAHTDLHTVGGTTVEIHETSGSPGYNVEAAFTTVDGLTDVYVHGYYTGNHTDMECQLYNYGTASWDTAFAFGTGQTTMQLYHTAIADGSPYFDGGGNAKVRFYHATTGNPSHRLYLDYLAISHSTGSTGGLALDDLTDVDTTGNGDGDVLTWDTGTSMWIASAPSPASDVIDIPTAETDTALVLAPDGAGGVGWRSELTLGAWPVGSVFISVVNTSPATLLGGGTWEAFGAGRVLVGIDAGDTAFDTVEETGGAKTVASSAQAFTGTASTAIVNHTHTVTAYVGTTDGTYGTFDSSSTTPGTAKTLTSSNPVTGGAASYTPVGTNAAGAATSVVQPYIVVYMWKRTA